MTQTFSRATSLFGIAVVFFSCVWLVGCEEAAMNESRGVTLAEWKQALSATYRVRSSESGPNGSTVSHVCVANPDGGACIPARLTLAPFEQIAYFEPEAHASTEGATVYTQVVVRDGRQPFMHVAGAVPGNNDLSDGKSTVALVLDGLLLFDTMDHGLGDGRSSFAYGTPSLSILTPAVVLSVEMREALKKMTPKTAIQARLSGSHMQESTQEVAGHFGPRSRNRVSVEIYLDEPGSQTLARNLTSMEGVHRTVSMALEPLRVSSSD